MNKRNLYTLIGVALSFVIAIGGWMLTNMLIERKWDALLSATGVMRINVPADEPDEDVPPPELSEEEIAAVLMMWENPAVELAHEPFDGQISMERAIEEAKAGLLLVRSLVPIPDEPLKIGAYLCQNVSMETDFLGPVYSYWTVSLYGRDTAVTMIINAVTGQIWKMTVAVPSDYVLYVKTVQAVLSEYISYLGFEDGGWLELGGRTQSIAYIGNGDLFAVFGESWIATYTTEYARAFTIYLAPGNPFFRNVPVDGEEFTT